VELPFEAARRAVPFATVGDSDGDSLRLASVHLITTPPPWRALVTGGSSRYRQALGLVDALERIEHDRSDCAGGRCPLAVVVAGDFNTWSARETARITTRSLRPSRSDRADRLRRDREPDRRWPPRIHMTGTA
jgi:endonuclease/exonuclease/phosphatase family metal-dependent hydrolase